MDITEVDALLDRHRDKFRRLLQTIVAEEAGHDPFHYPLHRFKALADDERATLVRRAALIAGDRVERELRSRGAAWLVLVGDEVVVASADPAAIPSPDDVLRLGEPRDLVAYLYEAPLIEELAPCVSVWSRLGSSDRYPTVPFVIENERAARTALVADLDTGSHATLIDADLAKMRASTWFTGRHLGEPFLWSVASIQVEVAQSAGAPLKRPMAVRVVRDWKSSPFTRIHSERKALVGRDFLRAFSLEVILRAASAETEIVAAH